MFYRFSYSECFYSIISDRVDKIRTLIELGANMDIQFSVHKYTPLHLCVFFGSIILLFFRLVLTKGNENEHDFLLCIRSLHLSIIL